MTPKDLADLVPYWFDDEFTSQQGANSLSAPRTQERSWRLSSAWEPAARAFCSQLPDWNDHWMVGTLEPETVSLTADLLAAAPVYTWAAQHRTELAEYVRELGYHRPFDDDWAEQVVRDIRELAGLFRAAAAAREAVILKIVA